MGYLYACCGFLNDEFAGGCWGFFSTGSRPRTFAVAASCYNTLGVRSSGAVLRSGGEFLDAGKRITSCRIAVVSIQQSEMTLVRGVMKHIASTGHPGIGSRLLQGTFMAKHRVGVLGLLAFVLTLAIPPALGHETDQYSVPVGRDFADLRFYFSEYFYDAISHAVDKLNARIDRTLQEGAATEATNNLYDPGEIVRAVFHEFPSVIYNVEALEMQLRAPQVQQRFPGMVVAYKPFFWIYHHPLLVIDPTKMMRLKRSSTVMINDVHLGTDKIVHFIHMGYLYYLTWEDSKARGRSDAEAVQDVIQLGTGAGPISENGFLGKVATGVWSNGDLAADYCGFKFYRNLTEPVRVRGEERPPMLVRDGPHFRLNDHVRRNSEFFSVFVSDHWDEVLNPNKYSLGAGSFVCESIRNRCEGVLDWYADDDGRPRTRDDFLQIIRQLSTYYGEDYGHSGDPSEMVSVVTCCFDKSDGEPRRRAQLAEKKAPPKASFRRTALWHAANDGALEKVRKELQAGADPNTADVDGETSLHRALRHGSRSVIEMLLAYRADPLKADRYGVTPLHLAARRMDEATFSRILAECHAVDPKDIFGRTPLHDAAEQGGAGNVRLLLKAGATPATKDVSGNTPLHLAARAGDSATISALLENGGEVLAVNSLGRTPIDEATLSRRDGALRTLEEGRTLRRASFAKP